MNGNVPMGDSPRPKRTFSAGGRSRIDREIDDEMRFHLDARTEALIRDGHSPSDAHRIALEEFGDVAAARAELASIDRAHASRIALRDWLGSWMQDVRFAMRGLRARPVFTLTILLTLALGVGANAAIFSVVDAMLLRALPFAEPDRLVHLWERFQTKVDNRSEASYPDYLDWRARTKSFTDLAGYTGGSFILGGEQPAMIGGARVTANFFNVLGVHAAAGRTFAAGEDDVGAPTVAMISYGLWEREFARSRSAIGRTITLNGAPATIVGVVPADYRFIRQQGVDVWIPLDHSARTRAQRGNHWLNIVGRLAPGVTMTQASNDLDAVMSELAREYPESNTDRRGQVVPLRQEFVGSVRPTLLLVYGAVLVVLLISCVNVANLLLIRGTDRGREIAVRIALGAGRGRIVRQLVTESIVLAVFGGIAGVGVAKLGVMGLQRILPDSQTRGMPAVAMVGLDPKVLAYAFGVALIAGCGFGLLSAAHIVRPATYQVLRGSGRGMIGGGSRLRDALVVGEIALTVLLVSGAALFGKSLIKLLSIDPGFKVEHAVSGFVVFPASSYRDPQAQVAAFSRLIQRLHDTPGISSVGIVNKVPLDFGNSLSFYVVGQSTPAPGTEPSASYRPVAGDYFSALGIPVVRGRGFGLQDETPNPRTVIVNRALAAAYLGELDPIGQRFFVFGDTMEVVGVVGDVPIGGIEDKIPPTLYVPFAKASQTAMSVVVRTSLGVDAVARALRAATASVDRTAAVTRVLSMGDVVERSPSVYMRRFPLYLLVAFSVTALLLAMVGVYGVVSYSMAQRAREMAVRMALGASPGSLVRLVVRHGSGMAIAGIVLGVAASLYAGRFAAPLLYGVAPYDPLTYVVVSLLLASVAIAATLFPARRVVRVDPALVLRSE